MISLNYRDSRPIYEQIKDGLRKLIVTGAMLPDEKLPSVRALAQQLSINPNTIQRAYADLEGEGYIYSVPGKGSFAAGHKDADAARREVSMRWTGQRSPSPPAAYTVSLAPTAPASPPSSAI